MDADAVLELHGEVGGRVGLGLVAAGVDQAEDAAVGVVGALLSRLFWVRETAGREDAAAR